MNRYRSISTFNNSVVKPGKRFYGVVKYPDIPLSVSDIYVITQKGDRYDLLADQYYGDSTLWWVISIANESFQQNSMILPEGQQIRIPVNISNILFNFERINQ